MSAVVLQPTKAPLAELLNLTTAKVFLDLGCALLLKPLSKCTFPTDVSDLYLQGVDFGADAEVSQVHFSESASARHAYKDSAYGGVMAIVHTK